MRVETVEIDNTEMRYEVRGVGEPVICLHANPFVDWYLPLIDRMPGYAFLRYTRRPLDEAPLSFMKDAVTCRRLAEHLGWERAHILGHSAGALAALQLALDAPEFVHTLALLEPAVSSPSSDNATADGDDPFGQIFEAFVAGDHETAITRFLTLVGGHGARSVLERAVPGAFEQAVQTCAFFFQVEVPSNMKYRFDTELGARISAPVLNVVGERTAPGFFTGADVVQTWLPGAQRYTLPDASHLLMVEQPDAMAAALKSFFETYPMS